MGMFDYFRKKKGNPEEESRSDDSLSVSLSKDSVSFDPSVPAGDDKDIVSLPDTISNEGIRKNDRILDTYEVISDPILGGMGSVWKVHHQSWNTDLAMKRPQPRFFAEGSRKRKEAFVRECENWINLGLHPNIVSCYYVREIGGVPTVFSEWMDNGSLKDRISDGSLYQGTPEEIQERILDIAVQTASGLSWSHENNLIHQDVKPGNLLLSAEGEAKVADFGLASFGDGQDGDAEKGFSGTPAYCPKEQAEASRPAQWMDVYAWALTVLEMYAGERKWKTGSEAKEHFSEYAENTRVKMPEQVRQLLRDCIVSRQKPSFSDLTGQLKQIYQEVCRRPYLRPEASSAVKAGDSENNRALSFIELHKEETALKLLQEAVYEAPSNTVCEYNYAVLQWNENRISLEEMNALLREYDDDSPACAAVRQRAEAIGNTAVRKAPPSRSFDYDPEGLYKINEMKVEIREIKENTVRFAREDGKEYTVRGNQFLDISPDGKKALSCLRPWYENGYYLTDLDEGKETYIPRVYIGKDNWLNIPRFCDPEGKLITAYRIHFGYMIFEAESGRALKCVRGTRDPDGYDQDENIWGYYPDGTLLAYSNEKSGFYLMDPPCVKEEPPYTLAKIRSYREYREELTRLAEVCEAVPEMTEAGQYDGIREMLEPFVSTGTLLLYPPAVDCWGSLSSHFRRDRLIAVLPEKKGKEIPGEETALKLTEPGRKDESTLNHASNGRYEIDIRYDYRSYENYNGSFDIDGEWSLTARDVKTKRRIFEIPSFLSHSQTDEGYWDKDLYAGFLSENVIWYAKEHDTGYETADLRECRPVFFLSGGSTVRNTENGLKIGDLYFRDTYTGCGSLLEADVLPGEKNDYRLIYSYKENSDDGEDQGSGSAGAV